MFLFSLVLGIGFGNLEWGTQLESERTGALIVTPLEQALYIFPVICVPRYYLIVNQNSLLLIKDKSPFRMIFSEAKSNFSSKSPNRPNNHQKFNKIEHDHKITNTKQLLQSSWEHHFTLISYFIWTVSPNLLPLNLVNLNQKLFSTWWNEDHINLSKRGTT